MQINRQPLLFIILPILVFTSIIQSQTSFDPVTDVPMSVTVKSNSLAISLKMPTNTHITSSDYGFFFVKPDQVEGVEYGQAFFPEGVEWNDETIYRGNIEISVPFNVSGDFNTGQEIKLSGIVGYQGCTEVDPIMCTQPVERLFSTLLVIESGNNAVSPIELDVNEIENLSIEQRVKRALETGSMMALIWIFIGGVLLSLTPCVYPVIPITIAFVGAKAGGSKLKGLSLSIVFVLGLAMVYSLLGVIAAATGGVFGLSGQNPWVIGFVTVVFLVMGAGMLGAFDITVPSSIQTKLASGKRSGYLGALFVGATTGLVAAPCVGPVLVALLSWVSATGNVFLGFLYLFVFAIGLGLLFVVIGTFAGALTALPKAGGWMQKVKYGFGIVLIVAAFYFGKPLVSDDVFTLLIGLGLILLAAFFGVFNRLEAESTTAQKIGRGFVFFMVIIGVFYLLLGLARIEGICSDSLLPSAQKGSVSVVDNHSSPNINWIYDDEDDAFSRARDEGKLVMIDFWAEWCAACKEMDHKTFADPAVYTKINQNFIALKIDGTKVTEEVKAIWAKYKVKGLPAIIFFSHESEELYRFEAFHTSKQVIPVLDRLGGK
ncbi:thioredoxin family protein [bacterium]|nr:thioredoxin family protein [bacterium]